MRQYRKTLNTDVMEGDFDDFVQVIRLMIMRFYLTLVVLDRSLVSKQCQRQMQSMFSGLQTRLMGTDDVHRPTRMSLFRALETATPIISTTVFLLSQRCH